MTLRNNLEMISRVPFITSSRYTLRFELKSSAQGGTLAIFREGVLSLLIVNFDNGPQCKISWDSLIARLGQDGTEDVQVRFNGVESIEFRVELKDLYIRWYKANGRADFSRIERENYSDLAKPSAISTASLLAAMTTEFPPDPKNMNKGQESSLVMMIFIIAEAARFGPARRLLSYVIQNPAVEVPYALMDEILHKWDKLLELAGGQPQIINAKHIIDFLPQLKPGWENSESRRLLADYKVLPAV